MKKPPVRIIGKPHGAERSGLSEGRILTERSGFFVHATERSGAVFLKRKSHGAERSGLNRTAPLRSVEKNRSVSNPENCHTSVSVSLENEAYSVAQQVKNTIINTLMLFFVLECFLQ